MTESYAVLVRVQQIIKKLHARANISSNNNNNNNNNGINNTNTSEIPTNNNIDLNEFMKNVVLFDACSGKGYAATLLSFVFPTLKVSNI